MASDTATATTLAPRIIRGRRNGRAGATSRTTSRATPATTKTKPAKLAKPAATKKQAAKAQPAKAETPVMPTTTIAAKGELATIVDSAKSAPITITLNGKPAAAVLSPRLYRQLQRVLRKIAEEEEDRDCIKSVRKSEKEGFLSPEENAAFIRRMRDAFGS